MTLNPIQECRVAVGDLDTSLPILSDATYEYFLTKNDYSVRRASLDAARTILMQLSLNSQETTVDIFSVKGGKAAEQYRLSLQMFLRDPSMNPVFTSANIYAAGISKSDMQANDSILDNNVVPSATSPADNPIFITVLQQ